MADPVGPDAKRVKVDDASRVKQQRRELPLQMLAVGFCGVDESVSPDKLIAMSKRAPWAEWGVLFRPEKEKEARFPSMEWVRKLSLAKLNAEKAIQIENTATDSNETGKSNKVRLAAHLCSSRCEQVLSGDPSFVQELFELGFRRVQVNATAANGVDTSKLVEQAPAVLRCVKAVPGMEWILQRNEETKPIWKHILAERRKVESELQNVSVLFDDSVGTGVTRTSFPSPCVLDSTPPCGYAGGIGPCNIRAILEGIVDSVGSEFAPGKYREPWIDMESSLRETDSDDQDIFSMDAVSKCVEAVEQAVVDRLVSMPPL